MRKNVQNPRPDSCSLLRSLETFLSLKIATDDQYLASKKALPAAARQLVRVYSRIRSNLQPEQRILDWGCRHGAFSFLVRADMGQSIVLDGCDICAPDEYHAHHQMANLRYKQIKHPWMIDYEDQSFDCIIAGGTLEHVPNDSASLNELWRILKPLGVLAITHLPNSTSWSEFVSRSLFPTQAHKRLYKLGKFRQQLLHHGFLPEQWGHHHLMPSSLPAALSGKPAFASTIGFLQKFDALENLWPIEKLSAASWIVARKHLGF